NEAGEGDGNDSDLTFAAVAGTTYRIAIDGKLGRNGNFYLYVNPAPPNPTPINDGSGVDIDATSISASLTANWINPTGYPLTGLSWCVDRSDRSYYSTCSSTVVTSGTLSGPPSSLSVPGPFADGKYFVCLRLQTAFVAASYYNCSDGITVDSGVASPVANDGPSATADIDWQTSGTSLQATWSAINDTSGINRYETCFSTSATCASGVLQGWTSQGTATTQNLTGLSLVAGTTYYACVRVYDNAGNAATNCSDGVRSDNAIVAPAAANDGATGDVDTWASTTDYTMNWSAVADAGSGIARYEYCLSTATGCTGTVVRNWANGGTGTTYSATGLALSLTTYYACIRAVDVAGNVSTGTCSDGALVVDPGPDPPTFVNDGAGADMDWTNVTSSLAGNWNSATDPQLARHEYCIASAAGCLGTITTNWTTAAASGGLAMNQTGLTLTHGSTYYIAVRGVDTGNNAGGPRTSDGVTVDTVAPSAVSPAVSSISSTPPTLSWAAATDTVSGVAFYRVYRSTTSGPLGAQVNADGATNGTTFVDASVPGAGSYFYTVRAVDRAGNEQTAGNAQVSASYVPRMYLRNAASTLATSPGASWQLQTTPGSAADSSSSVKVGGSTGYIQFQPGRSATQNKIYSAGLPSAPSGRGWMYQTALGSVPAAEWRFRMTVEPDVVHDAFVVARAWKVSTSGGSITASTPLMDWYEESAVNVGASLTPTTVDFTVPIPPTTFAAGEYLYVEYWNHVVSQPGGNNSSSFVVNTSSEYVEVVGPYVDTGVSASGSVRDGLGADVDYVAAASTTYPLSWNPVSDFSGVNRYEYCVSSITACGGAPIKSWTSAGTATSATATGVTLVAGTTYYACVRVYDNSGNVSVVSCSDGAVADGSVPAPSSVADGPVLDVAWTTSLTQLQANWPSVTDTGGSGIARYEFCMDDLNPCDTVGTPMVDWTSNGTSLIATRSTLALVNGTTYYTCVRAVDNAGNISAITCSDGQRVDSLAPNQPTASNDGAGADIDVQATTSSLTANWTSVADNGASGVSRYEYCFSATTSCGGTPVLGWTGNGLGLSATAGSLSLSNGITYYACARAVDVAGNVGTMRCSDGVLVDTIVVAPATVYDGSTALVDAAYTTSTTQLSANWTAVTGDASGIARYEVCLATATSCGGTIVDNWSNAGTATTYTSTGLSLVSGTTYFACVRAVDNAGNTSSMRCSNGQLLDATAPPAPSPINDGTGADIDGQLTASSISANWAGVVDPAPASGLARYEYCISDVTSCGGTPIVGWTSNATSTSYTVNGLSLAIGVPYYQCVRSHDTAGNVSAPSCSDGVQVTNTPPNSVTALLQREADGSTAIATGAWTRFGGAMPDELRLQFTVSDPDPVQVLTPWVEVIPTAGTFGATCGSAGATTWAGAAVTTAAAGASIAAEVRVTGLASGTSYKWRACTRDQSGAVSAWVARGSSPDFRLDAAAPTSPAPVNDGAGADIDAQLSPSTATANWSVSTDALSGFSRYDACVSTAPSCGGTVVLNWLNRGTATTLSQAVTLSSGATYYVAVRAVDAAGNTIVVSSDGVLVDTGPPPAPTPVRDGAGPGDIDVTSSTTSLQVTWAAVVDPEGSAIARYDHCVTTTAAGTDCAAGAAATWLAVGTGTSATRGSLSLVSGTTYRQC
ncbi:MAG: hypothetical protein JWM86_1429, partial [Thermoleophilia bacterium]|nr:hypothetical protein [Thermoleophilia bacterium]